MNRSVRQHQRRTNWVFIGIILFIPFFIGILLITISFLFTGEVRNILENVGIGFVGGILGSSLPVWIVGRVNFSQEITLEDALRSVSNLVDQARSLGMVAVGRERRSGSFENQGTLLDRWKYLLSRADEVDLLCIDDSMLLSNETLLQVAPIIHKRFRGSDKLTLRVLMSSDDNPALPMIGAWINNLQYATSEVSIQESNLRQHHLADPNILRRHKEMAPFTMLRGDTYMYVMFFMPNGVRGPILELRQREALDAAAASVDQENLFDTYKDLFDKWWDKWNPSKQPQP